MRRRGAPSRRRAAQVWRFLAVGGLVVLTGCGADASGDAGAYGGGPRGLLGGPEGATQWMLGSHFYVTASLEQPGFLVASSDPSTLAVHDTAESRAPSACGREGLCSLRRRIDAVGVGDAYLELRYQDGTLVDELLIGVRVPDRMVVTSTPDRDLELPMSEDDLWLVDSEETLRLHAIVYAGSYPLGGQPAVRASLQTAPACALTDGRSYDLTVAALEVGDHRLHIALEGDVRFERTITLRAVVAADVVRRLGTESVGMPVDSRGVAQRSAVRAVALTADLEVVHAVRRISWTADHLLGTGSTLVGAPPGVAPVQRIQIGFVRNDGSVLSHDLELPIGSPPEVRDLPAPSPTCDVLEDP
ncbi:MAG: hypothetical protein IT379_14820 [Deltaproteobacteria bacterium]|nr:hypothetical protein [Deltaproteobacteria bacterium]